MREGTVAIILVFLYTLALGSCLTSSKMQSRAPISITSVKRRTKTLLAVTLRNNLTYATHAELEGGRRPHILFLQPGEDFTVFVELARAPSSELRARESLAYVDEQRFDRLRITPYDVWQLEER